MTDLKSRFVSNSAPANSYLGASLNFMTADTRRGLTPAAQIDLSVIKAHGRTAYATKFEKPVSRSTASYTVADQM